MLLVIHIVFGTLAIVLGFMAMVSRKGSTWHKRSGFYYLLSMLVMSISAGLAAVFLPQAINVLAAGLTAYLVFTGWWATNAGGKEKLINGLAFGFILSVTLACFSTAYMATLDATGTVHGFAAEFYLFLGVIALIATVLDIKMLRQSGLKPASRLRRHIWRMSFSYFIAAGSLFTGPGATAFPQALRDSGLLSLPEPAILLFIGYWLFKTTRRRAKFWIKASN